MMKKSISLDGHRTSVRLEREFWTALERAAAARALSLPGLVKIIDAERLALTPAPNLASALRVYALKEASAVRDEGKGRPSED